MNRCAHCGLAATDEFCSDVCEQEFFRTMRLSAKAFAQQRAQRDARVAKRALNQKLREKVPG